MASAKETATKAPKKKSVQPVDNDQWLEIFSIFIHDIESPIASVKYLLQLICQDRFDMNKPQHHQLAHACNVAIGRSESILFDIMAVARSGKVGIPVKVTSLVPTAVIEEAIELVSGSLQENQSKITFTNNSGDMAVQADPKLLKRVLDNLIYNAVRHTPRGGTIAIYTEPAKDSVYIHVKDSGEGLGDIEPAELFEKYGQVHLRGQGKHRGVGLGLYFCRLAATGMGGTMMVDDHPEGGAVFSIRLKKAKG